MAGVDWGAVVQTITATGFIVAGLVYLAKAAMTHMLGRDLESFKTQLQTDAALEVERFKADVNLTAQKQLVEFSALNAKRADLVARIYNQVDDLNLALGDLIRAFMNHQLRDGRIGSILDPSYPIDKEGEDALDEVRRAANRLLAALGPQRIWFSEETEKRLYDVVGKCFRLLNMYDAGTTAVGQEAKQAATQAFVSAQSSTNAALTRVKEDFRRLLGVAN